MLDFLKQLNDKLFHWSYKEILEDLDFLKSRLEHARVNNAFDAIKLFDGLCKRLVSELQGSDCAEVYIVSFHEKFFRYFLTFSCYALYSTV